MQKKGETVAVFGADGMLGRYVVHVLKDKHNIAPYTRAEFDIEKDNVKDLPKFKWVVNCAGLTNKRSGDFYKINYIFPLELSRTQNLIQISTDCVFGGKTGMYNVDDPLSARSEYGITKFLGEHGTVIRTSIIGDGGDGTGLIEWLRGKKDVGGYINHFWNGVTCLELARFISKGLEYGFCETKMHFHSNIVTKYELCKYISEIYGWDIKINPIEAKERIDRTLVGIKSATSIYDQIKQMYNEGYDK